ncbi:hypothetical protein ABPG73_020945 [Tetrahymena malaccensis]
MKKQKDPRFIKQKQDNFQKKSIQQPLTIPQDKFSRIKNEIPLKQNEIYHQNDERDNKKQNNQIITDQKFVINNRIQDKDSRDILIKQLKQPQYQNFIERQIENQEKLKIQVDKRNIQQYVQHNSQNYNHIIQTSNLMNLICQLNLDFEGLTKNKKQKIIQKKQINEKSQIQDCKLIQFETNNNSSKKNKNNNSNQLIKVSDVKSQIKDYDSEFDFQKIDQKNFEIGNLSKKGQEQNKQKKMNNLNNQCNGPNQKLSFEDKQFLQVYLQDFQYLTSGGEADIYYNYNKSLAQRIVVYERSQNSEIFKEQFQEIINNYELKEAKHILKYKGHQIIENDFKVYIIIYMQLCEFSLKNLLQNEEYLSLAECMEIIFYLISSLIELRQNYLYHSDIKPDNLLKLQGKWLLSDFGCSTQIDIYSLYQGKDISKGFTQGYKPLYSIFPFYHDMYSVCKTMQRVIYKTDFGYAIMLKQILNNVVSNVINKDQSNLDLEIDCFQLMNQFVKAALSFYENKEIKNFLRQYLQISLTELQILNEDQEGQTNIKLDEIVIDQNQLQIINKLIKKQEKYQFYQESIYQKVKCIQLFIPKIILASDIQYVLKYIEASILLQRKDYQKCSALFRDLSTIQTKLESFQIQSQIKLCQALLEMNALDDHFFIYIKKIDLVAKKESFQIPYLVLIYRFILKYRMLQYQSLFDMFKNIESVKYLEKIQIASKIAYGQIYVGMINDYLDHYKSLIVKNQALYTEQLSILDTQYDKDIDYLFDDYTIIKYQRISSSLYKIQGQDENQQTASFVFTQGVQLDQTQKEIKEFYDRNGNLYFINVDQLQNLQDFLESVSSYEQKCSKEQIFGIIFSVINILMYLQIHKKFIFNFNLESIIQKSDIEYMLSFDQLKEFQKQNLEQIDIDCVYERNMLVDFLYFVLNMTQASFEYEDLAIRSLKNAINLMNQNQKSHFILFIEKYYQQQAAYLEKIDIDIFDTDLIDLILLLCYLFENLAQNQDFITFIEKYVSKKIVEENLFQKNNDQAILIFIVLIKSFIYSNIQQGYKYDDYMLNYIQQVHIKFDELELQKYICLDRLQSFKHILYLPRLYFYKLTIHLDNIQLSEINEVQSIAKVLEKIDYESLVFYLRNNQIGDQGCEIISKGLNKNKKINKVKLIISQNNIGFKGANSLIKGMEGNKYINKLNLDLGEGNINLEVLTKIASVIKQNKYLRSLKLITRSNCLNDLSANIISKVINEESDINELDIDLSNNNITIFGLELIFLSIQKNKRGKIFKINLSSNNFYDDTSQKLQENSNSVKCFAREIKIYLNDSCIGKTGKQILINLLGSIYKDGMLTIELNFNKLRDIDVYNILQSNQRKFIYSLRLSLMGNEITHLGCIYIHEKIKLQDLLKIKLYLSKNKIHSQGAIKILNALQSLRYLEYLTLHLSSNKIDNSLAYQLAYFIQQNKKIMFMNIDLSHNLIDFLAAKLLIQAIKLSQCEKISLDLSFNQLTNQEIYQLISLFGKQTHKNLKIQFHQHADQSLTLDSFDLFDKFNIGVNEISRKGENLRIYLEQSVNLISLVINLSYSNINEENILSLLSYLERCFVLISLTIKLEGNDLTEKTLQHLSRYLEQCRNISNLNLYLGDNNLNIDNALNLVKNLQYCENLINLKLNLQKNQIAKEGIYQILNLIANYQNLKKLSVNLMLNKQSLQEQYIFNSSLSELENLTILSVNIEDEQINDLEAFKFSCYLKNISNLAYLKITFRYQSISQQMQIKLMHTIKRLCFKLITLKLKFKKSNR